MEKIKNVYKYIKILYVGISKIWCFRQRSTNLPIWPNDFYILFLQFFSRYNYWCFFQYVLELSALHFLIWQTTRIFWWISRKFLSWILFSFHIFYLLCIFLCTSISYFISLLICSFLLLFSKNYIPTYHPNKKTNDLLTSRAKEISTKRFVISIISSFILYFFIPSISIQINIVIIEILILIRIQFYINQKRRCTNEKSINNYC